MMAEATITSKGQVTIPKIVRQSMHLREGQEIVFILEGDHAVIRPKARTTTKDLLALADRLPAIPQEEIDEMRRQMKKEWSKWM